MSDAKTVFRKSIDAFQIHQIICYIYIKFKKWQTVKWQYFNSFQVYELVSNFVLNDNDNVLVFSPRKLTKTIKLLNNKKPAM